MSRDEAEDYWWDFYSDDFFDYWNARAKAERDKELLFKLGWFCFGVSTVSTVGGLSATVRGVQSVRLSTRSISMSPLGHLSRGGVKTGIQIAEQTPVHGNSLKRMRPTWGYKLYSIDGTFLKNGITSQPIPEARYTKLFMLDKFMKVEPLFPNRLDAYKWEYQQNLIQPGPLNFNKH